MSTTTRFDLINASLPSDLGTKAGRQAAARAKVSALTVDQCVRAHTAMATLAEIVACTLRDGYRPSLYTTARSSKLGDLHRAYLAERIADAYDAEMARLGRSERAFRGH